MPSEIGVLTSLERLVIAGMEVSGSILDYLNGTEKLSILDVHSNTFTGTIPDTFSKEHPALIFLNLELNQFNGEIPKSIGTLTSLTTLNLQHNQIKGSIPSELAAIPTLRKFSFKPFFFFRRRYFSYLFNDFVSEFVDIGDNLLTGEIPLEMYDEKFITLRMTNNAFDGSISTLIGTMSNLTDFTIGSSFMEGSIPTELYRLTKLVILDLHNSSFTGPLPESGFANLIDLSRFEVHGNDFTGTIPTMAIANMTNLERLQLQDNDRLTGYITEEICEMRGVNPNAIQVLVVGCNVECFAGCCDDNPECEESLYV
jgi:hypothetical protein